MSFIENVGENRNNEFPLMKEGRYCAIIQKIEEVQNKRGGKTLYVHCTVIGSNKKVMMFITSDSVYPKAVRIGEEIFNNILIQINDDLVKQLKETKDYSVLNGSQIFIVCKNRLYNGSLQNKFYPSREDANKKYNEKNSGFL